MSADLDVVAYLSSKGLKGRQANGPEVAYPCFFDCAELPNSTKRKLYVNTEDGVYDCKVCGAQGGTFLLQKHFGDDPKMAAASDDSFARRRILTHAAETGVTMLENNDDALLWLLNRGLDPETIAARKIGFVGKGWSLTGSLPEGYTKDQLKHTGLVYVDGPRAGQDFFYDHVLIPYLHRNQVVQIRGRAWDQQAKAKYVTGQGDSPRLFNADDLDGADEVIITEGEFDAMILKQTLTNSPEDRPKKIAVVGLAGTNALPDNFESYFYEAKRIFIGFDSDEAGQRGAEKIRERLGSRARVMQLPYEDGRKCDWTEYLLPVDGFSDAMWQATHPYAGHSWRDVLRLMGAASGKRIFSIAEAGMAFREYRAINDGFKTGYSELDTIILPGLLPGQLMVYLAKTGAGKTVFLCNLAYQMRAHKQLIVSLEMTREEVYERLRRIYLHYNEFAEDPEVEFALANIYICDMNRLGEKDLDTLLGEFEVEAGASVDVVYIDYLGYFARGAQGNSQYEKVTNAVMSLKAVAKAHRAVMIAPAQVNRLAKEGKPIDLDDARDSGAVEETADFLFSLYRPDDAASEESKESKVKCNSDGEVLAGVLSNGKPNYEPAHRVKLAVLKSRHGGKGKDITLVMDMLTLAIVDRWGDRPSEIARVKRHNAKHMLGTTWQALRDEQVKPRQYDIQGRLA